MNVSYCITSALGFLVNVSGSYIRPKQVQKHMMYLPSHLAQWIYMSYHVGNSLVLKLCYTENDWYCQTVFFYYNTLSFYWSKSYLTYSCMSLKTHWAKYPTGLNLESQIYLRFNIMLSCDWNPIGIRVSKVGISFQICTTEDY